MTAKAVIRLAGVSTASMGRVSFGWLNRVLIGNLTPL
jgi:hypothetical protein